MQDVLVLNKNYFAIQVIDWRDVMRLLYTDHAVVVDKDYATYNFEQWRELSQVMEENPSGFIHTCSFKIAIPDVISLTKYDRLPQKEVKFTRKTLYSQYDHKCCYCGKRFRTEDLNLDHVLPRSKGGATDWLNIVLSCIPCNSKKDNNTPKEAKMPMHYQPYKPKWKPFHNLNISTGIKIRQSWQTFIDKIYWDGELERN